MTDPTGTYQFTFDPSTALRAGFMGRLTGTSTQYAFLTSRTFTTSKGYDAASNRPVARSQKFGRILGAPRSVFEGGLLGYA